jgi:hypothetical protein
MCVGQWFTLWNGQTRKDHPYMTKERFPADWAAAEMLKQYMKNHRKHAVRKGRMERQAKKGREPDETNGREGSDLRNVDDDDFDGENDDIY